MVRGQTVAQPHCQFQRLLIVYCFESSTHAHQYTITGQRYLLLSDKLLGARNQIDLVRLSTPFP